MGVTIKGICKYNKVLEGVYEQGKRKGEQWEFLSLEVVDNLTGFTWSCQLPQEDSSYKHTPDNSLKGHMIKARITSQTAGERTMPDGKTVMQIRSQVTRLEDLGEVEDDE